MNAKVTVTVIPQLQNRDLLHRRIPSGSIQNRTGGRDVRWLQ